MKCFFSQTREQRDLNKPSKSYFMMAFKRGVSARWKICWTRVRFCTLYKPIMFYIFFQDHVLSLLSLYPSPSVRVKVRVLPSWHDAHKAQSALCPAVITCSRLSASRISSEQLSHNSWLYISGCYGIYTLTQTWYIQHADLCEPVFMHGFLIRLDFLPTHMQLNT